MLFNQIPLVNYILFFYFRFFILDYFLKYKLKLLDIYNKIKNNKNTLKNQNEISGKMVSRTRTAAYQFKLIELRLRLRTEQFKYMCIHCILCTI